MERSLGWFLVLIGAIIWVFPSMFLGGIIAWIGAILLYLDEKTND